MADASKTGLAVSRLTFTGIDLRAQKLSSVALESGIWMSDCRRHVERLETVSRLHLNPKLKQKELETELFVERMLWARMCGVKGFRWERGFGRESWGSDVE